MCYVLHKTYRYDIYMHFAFLTACNIYILKYKTEVYINYTYILCIMFYTKYIDIT